MRILPSTFKCLFALLFVLCSLTFGVIPTQVRAAGNIIRVPLDQPTIQAGINAAATGDTVLVSPGVYYEDPAISGKTITLASLYATTLDPQYIDSTIIDLQGGEGLYIAVSVGPDTTVEGFTIQNGVNGIISYAKVNILNNHIVSNNDGLEFTNGGGVVRGNIIELGTDDGIDTNKTTEVLIENNIIRNNHGDGIEARFQSFTGNMISFVVRNNQFISNDSDGVQLIGYPGLPNRTVWIERNLFINNLKVGLGLMDTGESGEDYRGGNVLERIYVFNNTFVGNKYALTGGDNLVAVNNIFANSTVQGLKNVDANSIVTHSLFWKNVVNQTGSNLDNASTWEANPLLDSEYKLTPGSPAIDAGLAQFTWEDVTVLNIPPQDYAGAAPDLGKYESGSPNHTITLTGPVAPGYGDSVTLTAALSEATTGTITFYESTGGTDVMLADVSITDANTAAYTFPAGSRPGAGAHLYKATIQANNVFPTTSDDYELTVARRPLTVTGITASNKVYDRSTTAALVGSGSLQNIYNNEAVSLSGTPAGAFDSLNAGIGKTVTISGLSLSGTPGVLANYTLTQPTTTASITTRALTVSGISAANKTYDRTTVVTLDVAGAVLSGVIAGDSVTVTGATGHFNNASAGPAKPVTVDTVTLNNANYSVTTMPTGVTAEISPKALTVSGISASNKTYDRTTTVPFIIGSAVLNGVISGDIVTVTGATGHFNDANAGPAKPVTVDTVSLSSANYQVTNLPTGLTADILPVGLTVTGITAEDKVYDGANAAVLSGLEAAALVGVVGSEDVTLDTSGAAGAFNTPGAGLGKIVTISGLALHGTATLTNYILTQPATTADITPLTVTVTPAAGLTKVYGTADPKLGFTWAPAWVPQADFSGALSRAAGVNVGLYAFTQGSLALSSNYTLTIAPGITFAITPAKLTISAENKTKMEGQDNPALTYTISGFVNHDSQAAVVTGVPALSTTAEKTSPAGEYRIGVEAGSLALTTENYTFEFVDGTLSVRNNYTLFLPLVFVNNK